MRSPSRVRISSPTMTVRPGGRGGAGLEGPLDRVVVGDREVGQAAPGGRRDHGPRRGQRVEAGRRVAVQVDEGTGRSCGPVAVAGSPTRGRLGRRGGGLRRARGSHRRAARP